MKKALILTVCVLLMGCAYDAGDPNDIQDAGGNWLTIGDTVIHKNNPEFQLIIVDIRDEPWNDWIKFRNVQQSSIDGYLGRDYKTSHHAYENEFLTSGFIKKGTK